MIKPKVCKDCIAAGAADTKRVASYPGPRCWSHHIAKRNKVRVANHARRTEATYGLTAQEYQAIYEAQGGHCFICRRATGKTKRLAVDHEHDRLGCDHPRKQGCHLCVRALLCGPCNQILGRYGVEALHRAIEVLTYPPAQKVLVST